MNRKLFFKDGSAIEISVTVTEEGKMAKIALQHVTEFLDEELIDDPRLDFQEEEVDLDIEEDELEEEELFDLEEDEDWIDEDEEEIEDDWEDEEEEDLAEPWNNDDERW